MENILQKELKVQANHLRGVPRNFAKEQEDQEDEKDRKQMQEKRYRTKLEKSNSSVRNHNNISN